MPKREADDSTQLGARKKSQPFSLPKNAATKAKIENNSQTSPLLRLPREIRDRIWTFVLGGKVLHIYDANWDTWEFGNDEEWAEHEYNCVMSEDVKEKYSSHLELTPWRTTSCVSSHTLDQDYEHSKLRHPLPRVIDPSRTGTPNSTRQEEFLDRHGHCNDFLVYPYNSTYFKIPESEPDPDPIQLQLLRVCRQAYLEAVPILWSTTTFSFLSKTAHCTFEKWMAGRTSFQKKNIRSLHLSILWSERSDHSEWSRPLAMKTVKQLTGLRELHIDIENRCLPSKKGEGVWCSAELAQLIREEWSEELLKFRVLPLEHVTVIVSHAQWGYPQEPGTEWSKEETREFAEYLRSRLLDPCGAVDWQSRLEEQKKIAEQKKERRRNRMAQKICSQPGREACRARRQKTQVNRDAIQGRHRKKPYVAETCDCQHDCGNCHRLLVKCQCPSSAEEAKVERELFGDLFGKDEETGVVGVEREHASSRLLG